MVVCEGYNFPVVLAAIPLEPAPREETHAFLPRPGANPPRHETGRTVSLQHAVEGAPDEESAVVVRPSERGHSTLYMCIYRVHVKQLSCVLVSYMHIYRVYGMTSS